jgi:hypothetical protein
MCGLILFENLQYLVGKNNNLKFNNLATPMNSYAITEIWLDPVDFKLERCVFDLPADY